MWGGQEWWWIGQIVKGVWESKGERQTYTHLKLNIAPENDPAESSLPTIFFQGLCETSGEYVYKISGSNWYLVICNF